uniref:Uncharacterized protein n=1 Tax=Anguilla anguilla TaxID=7936 RepID=A0A0E9TER1_ANGAN
MKDSAAEEHAFPIHLPTGNDYLPYHRSPVSGRL